MMDSDISDIYVSNRAILLERFKNPLCISKLNNAEDAKQQNKQAVKYATLHFSVPKILLSMFLWL